MHIRSLGHAIILAGLTATPALAQSSMTGANNGANQTLSTNPSTSNSTAPTGSAGGLLGSRIQQTHGGYLSSKLVGATVYNNQDQSIGSVDDLIIDTNGQVSSAVISVGGFLGVGSKLVDIPFSQLQFKQDGSASGREVVLPGATQQSLKSMQDFSYKG